MTLARGLEAQEDRLLNCVHCGFCLPACPTYARLGDEADSPRGRLYLMRAVVEGRLDAGSDAFQTHIDRCLGCRACEPVCPSGVEYGSLLEMAREAATAAKRPPLFTRALLGSLRRPRLFALSMIGSRLLRATGIPALGARLLPSRGRAGQLRLALAMLAASGASRGADSRRSGRTGAPREGQPDAAPTWTSLPLVESTPVPVALLTGCVQDALFRRVNEATGRVLEANGFRVRPVAAQRCCGALHAHAGDLEGARAMARVNIDAFEKSGVEAIAVNSAGCGAAMKEYGHLLHEDPEYRERAERLSRIVKDVSELLAPAGDVSGVGRPGGSPLRQGAPLPLSVAYDAPCHLLHAQRVAAPPVALLRSIPGLELLPLKGAEECCGGAGIYAVTHPELGGRIGGDKVASIRESGAEIVATGNPGCMMQIGAGLRMAGLDVAVRHPVELLDESYRRGGVYRNAAAPSSPSPSGEPPSSETITTP